MIVRRSVMRYHGGKTMLAPWIVSHFPKHRVYVEPFGGGASVLMRKDRSYSEVYNEIDPEVVNAFAVLRDTLNARKLRRALINTPFSRDEFELSYQPSDDPVEQARRTLFRCCAGFGSAAASKGSTGFRANSNRSGTTPAHDWANYPNFVRHWSERLRGVVIENRDALDCMNQHDGPQTLHYVDPPYLLSTRWKGADKKGAAYRFEMTEDDHKRLLTGLRRLSGMVVLSGYASDLYESFLPDWQRLEREARADGARDRIEVLWLNHACVAAIESEKAKQGLFAEVS